LVLISGQLLQLFFDQNLFVPEFWRPNILNENSIYLIRRPSVYALVSDHEIGISILAIFSLFFGYTIRLEKVAWFWLLIAVLYSLLTNTRYIMVGIAILILQFYFSAKSYSGKIRYLILVILTLLIGYYILVNAFGYDIKELYNDRLFAEGDITKTSRFYALEVFIRHFPKSPGLEMVFF
jgi:hypothetical protein